MSDFFTAEFFARLVSIIIIDLTLAGDNALVIALAVRNLPPPAPSAFGCSSSSSRPSS